MSVRFSSFWSLQKEIVMVIQVLENSAWQTIGTIIAIIVLVASLFNYIRSSKSHKETIFVIGIVSLVTLVIFAGIYGFISLMLYRAPATNPGLALKLHPVSKVTTVPARVLTPVIAPMPTATPSPTIAPTPIPTAVPTPSAYYRADWGTGFDGWNVSSQWSLSTTSPGMLTTDGSLANDWVLSSTTIPLKNYSVKVQIQKVGYQMHDNSMAFGILVRQKAHAGGYACGFGIGTKGLPEHAFIDLVAVSSNDGKDYIQGSLLPDETFNLDNQWHTYEIDINDNTIIFKLDQQQIYNITDITYLSGEQVGLFDSYTALNVKNFVVTSLG
jgi:hypothetical protein